MSDSINSNYDNLADIVGMDAITAPATASPLFIVTTTIFITIILLVFYYHYMHGLKGKLRHIKYQLQHDQVESRAAAHQLALLLNNQALTQEQLNLLKTLRFAENNPSSTQIIEFISHVK